MKRRALLQAAIASSAMIAASVGAWSLQPQNYLAATNEQHELEALIPRKFGAWEVDPDVEVVLPLPEVQARLDRIYSSVLARTYSDGAGRQIMLSVAYGADQSDATVAHRPEVCYSAQGFGISEKHLSFLEINRQRLPVARLVATLGDRVEPITYWMVVGDRAVATGWGIKRAQVEYGLRGLIADGFLIRVSSINSDKNSAYADQARFLIDLLDSTPSAARLGGFVMSEEAS